MILLPYVGLPIYPEKIKDVEVIASVMNLPDSLLDICYMMKTDTGNYYFQLGFYINGSIFTNGDRIKKVHNEILSFTPKLEWWILDELVEHLTLYCEQMDYIPAWGNKKYYDYVASGKTARRLDGPHKGARLSRTESRWVVYDEHKELVYGPTIAYLAILEKRQSE